MSRSPRKDNNEPKPLYERQLEEILRDVERTQQRRQIWSELLERLGRLGRGRGRAGGSRGRSLPFSRLLLFGIGLAVAGVVLQSLVPTLRGVGGLLILGGILLFLSPIVLSLGRPRGGAPGDPGERLWRGRPVVYHTDPWRTRLNDLLRWFRGGSNRPPPGPPPRRGRWN
jgi:hypothetical protein